MSTFEDIITEKTYNELSPEYKNEYIFSHNEDQYITPWEFTTIKMYKLKKANIFQIEILSLGRDINKEEYTTLSLAQQSKYELASISKSTYRKNTTIDQYTYDQLDKELKKEYTVCGYIGSPYQKEMYMVLNLYKKKINI